jgi:hypothetical protein
MRASTPFSWRTISSSLISCLSATTASDRLKPMAKSSRSAGVAIITAYVEPS